ncbi:hypothetical protein [Brevundimonas sp.]|uniref:hypothetical protein n=1 Tax=Brevundimonas sp. TaxID=1871086 RepID=UPI00289E0706|nr:hypothetical protein [Brevundimonas sp.]
MTNDLIKKLARSTRLWRVRLGLAPEPQAGAARMTRSIARRALPGGRVAALEADIDNMMSGWNQHIPQILSEIGQARRATAEVEQTCEQIGELEVALQALTAEVKRLEEQLNGLPRNHNDKDEQV